MLTIDHNIGDIEQVQWMMLKNLQISNLLFLPFGNVLCIVFFIVLKFFNMLNLSSANKG